MYNQASVPTSSNPLGPVGYRSLFTLPHIYWVPLPYFFMFDSIPPSNHPIMDRGQILGLVGVIHLGLTVFTVRRPILRCLTNCHQDHWSDITIAELR